MGYATIPVIRRLKIGVISTGDELKPPGTELAYGEIYESNSYGISGLVKMLGHTPIRYPAVHDSIEALRNQFDVAAEECDLFITWAEFQWGSGIMFESSWRKKAILYFGE